MMLSVFGAKQRFFQVLQAHFLIEIVLFSGKTRIMTAPKSVMVEEDTEAKFTCTATTDPDEIQNLRVRGIKISQASSSQVWTFIVRWDGDLATFVNYCGLVSRIFKEESIRFSLC